MEYCVRKELGVRYWLPEEKKMVKLDRGYQICRAVYYKDPDFVSVRTKGVAAEQKIFMRKLTEDSPGVYELDVLAFSAGLGEEKGVVCYDENSLSYVVRNRDHCYPFKSIESYRVVGNIYENQDALEAEKSPKRDDKVLNIYLKTNADGSWEYEAVFGEHTKHEEGCFKGYSEKFATLWGTIKALSEMKATKSPIVLHIKDENFTNLINSDRLKQLQRDEWKVDGQAPKFVEGYKRLYAEIQRFSSVRSVTN